jgi:hypothetical protein
MLRYKDAWYKLSSEEQNELMAKNVESRKQLGVEGILICNSVWASEEWLGWGVEKYPDIEAVQKHAEFLISLNWFDYIESKTLLGTEFPME